MHIVSTDLAPAALGHYSQAITHNGLAYISGQLPLDPNTGTVPEGIEAQTALVLKNLDAVLVAAKSDKSKVLKVTVYIADIALWGAMNAAYATYFGEYKPARAAVPVPTLPKGCLLEVEAIAISL
jgi:2-iminobutanoate/2-iminopropanoate deaminase